MEASLRSDVPSSSGKPSQKNGGCYSSKGGTNSILFWNEMFDEQVPIYIWSCSVLSWSCSRMIPLHSQQSMSTFKVMLAVTVRSSWNIHIESMWCIVKRVLNTVEFQCVCAHRVFCSKPVSYNSQSVERDLSDFIESETLWSVLTCVLPSPYMYPVNVDQAYTVPQQWKFNQPV
jgi:hypothetical protein